MSKKAKNNGVNAPNGYMLTLLNGDKENYKERKNNSFEDSIVRQYCQAIIFPKNKMRESQDAEGFLTFDSLAFWPNDLEPELSNTYPTKYEELARQTYKQVEREYLKLLDYNKPKLLIVNDNTLRANRGCAIFHTNDSAHLQGIEGEVLVKRGPYNNCLIIGEPYNIFRLLVNINLIAEYEASEEDNS